MNQVWRSAPSSFETGGAYGWLWYIYGFGKNSLFYQRIRQRSDQYVTDEFLQIIQDWKKQGVPDRLVPFRVAANGDVHAIRSMVIVGMKEEENLRFDFQNHRATDPSRLLDIVVERRADGIYEVTDR